MLSMLDEAHAARILERAPGAAARLRFSHVLVRDALYEHLSRPGASSSIGTSQRRSKRGTRTPQAHDCPSWQAITAQAGPAFLQQAVDYAIRAGDYAAKQLRVRAGSATLRGRARADGARRHPTAHGHAR